MRREGEITRTTYTLESLDVTRCGSICASFRREDGGLFALFVREARQAGENVEPELKKCIEAPYTSPVTAITDMDWRLEETTISWDEARRILSRMKHQLDGFDAHDRELFHEMRRVAARCGQPG